MFTEDFGVAVKIAFAIVLGIVFVFEIPQKVFLFLIPQKKDNFVPDIFYA